MNPVSQTLERIFGVPFTPQTTLEALRQYHSPNTFCCNAEGELIGIFSSENDYTEIKIPTDSAEMKWSKLEYLNLSDNKKLQRLTFEAALPRLQHLDMSDCQLKELTLPTGFEALQWLDASRNKLQQVDLAEAIPMLAYLDLSGNQLNMLEIPDCPKLQYLYLNNNQLEKLAFRASLSALEILHLRNNKLENLPDNFLTLTSLETLYLHGNPLSSIPKDLIAEGERENSLSKVRNYLESLVQAGDKVVENDEVKLVLLGNSTAGKSSLVRYLKDQIYDEQSLSSTHGIQNLLWKPEELGYKINIWDFGGQEYYHATHRLFLSHNAVTLILFEQDTNFQGEKNTNLNLYEDGELVKKEMPIQHFPYSYWLDSLDYFCKGHQPDTIVLAQSKMDIPTVKTIPIQENTREKYNIQEDNIFRVSVKGAFNQEDIHPFQYQIFIKKLYQILLKAKATYQFNPNWLTIKDKLRELGQSKPLLSYEDYKDFCESIQPGISQSNPDRKDSMLDTLTDYLHNISVILYYPDIKELTDTVFINPQWVTDTIYKVLDYKVIRDEGKFDKEHVTSTIPDFDSDKLIALMKQFELIFEIKNELGNFIAPQYLPIKNKEETSRSFLRWLQRCDKLAFSLHYPTFLPQSVMTRFICRYGNLALDTFWKNGIVFELNSCAYIVECESNNTIKVKTERLEPLQIGELFQSLYEISHKNPEIQVSVNGTDFVKIQQLLDHSSQNPKIQSANGDWINVEDFYQLGIGGKGQMEHFIGFSHKKLPQDKKTVSMKHIQDLVGKSRLQEAINELLKTVPNQFRAEVISLQQRLNELEKKVRLNIISNADANLERNQITVGLLNTITAIEITPDSKPDETIIPHADTPSDSTKAKIYFSYAWGDDQEEGVSREAIVNELYSALIKEGFNVLRDKMNIDYGGLISEFMKDLGAGDLIVVFVSDKYVKSPYCMFELYEIARNNKWDKKLFASRILPVPVERIRFDDPSILDHYFEYWKQEEQKWEALIQKRLNQIAESQSKRYHNTKAIHQNFGNLSDWLTDINASTLKLLSDSDFAKVKEAIQKRMSEN